MKAIFFLFFAALRICCCGQGDSDNSLIKQLINTKSKTLLLKGPKRYKLSGFLNLHFKTIIIEHGTRITGAVTIINGTVDAPLANTIFDTSVKLGAGISNTVVSPDWWGAGSSASAAINNIAFERIAQFINAKGGKAVIQLKSSAKYIVGAQSFAGRADVYNAYTGRNLLSLYDCKDVVLQGNGATIKAVGGLKIGSFNPVTGKAAYPAATINHKSGYDKGSSFTINVLPLTVRMSSGKQLHFSNGAIFTLAAGVEEGATALTGNLTNASVANGETGSLYAYDDYNYRSSAGTMIDLKRCKNIVIKNLTLDGNIQEALPGGGWGSGYEVGGIGIQAVEVSGLRIENVCSMNQVTDGMGLINYAYTDSSAIKQVNLINCTFLNNGRQGLSWDGGNHLYAVNCSFSNTGQAINKRTGQKLYSGPGGGIDIEPEADSNNVPLLTQNGRFNHCRFENNVGISFLVVGGNRAKNIVLDSCIIENNFTGAVWANGQYVTLNNTRVNGTVVTNYPASGFDDPRRTRYIHCHFSMRPEDFHQPLNKNSGNTHMSVFDGQYVLLQNCTGDFDTHPLPWTYQAEFENCIFKNKSSEVSYVRGLYKGTNHFTILGSKGLDINGSILHGTFLVNGKKVPTSD